MGVTGEKAVKTADRVTTLVSVKPLNFVVTKTRLYLKGGQNVTCYVCGDQSNYCTAKTRSLPNPGQVISVPEPTHIMSTVLSQHEIEN